MSNPFPSEDSALDREIDRVYSQLPTWGAEDKEYQAAVDRLTQLYQLRRDQSKLNLELHQTNAKNNLEAEQAQHDRALADSRLALELAQAELEREQNDRSWLQRVEPSTVVTVAGNLAVALIVVKYEQTGVIASKVMTFMKKI